MARIASIVVSNATRKFDRVFHYRIPEYGYNALVPGVRVIVPFGRSDRPVEGYVLGLSDQEGEAGELKEIKEMIDDKPVLQPDMLELCRWMKKRYICTYSDAIRCMLPPGGTTKSMRVLRLEQYKEDLTASAQKIVDALKESGDECEYDELKERLGIRNFSQSIKKLDESGIITVHEEYSTRVKEKLVRVAFLIRSAEEVIEEIESNRIRKIQQIRVLEMLLDSEYISVSDIVRFAGVSAGVVNTLKKNGYIDFKNIEVLREPGTVKDVKSTCPLEPTPQQKSAIDYIRGYLDRGEFREILLHGVTGSGKTEVYLQLIQYCIEKGREAIVLVPEISLTPQMVERFKGRFGEHVAVLHSRLSLGERYDQWRMIHEGKIQVVVGARSAIFAPLQSLGIVIIDEEHENTYKSETTPKYHVRDIAAKRCEWSKAVLLYGSATPSVETYFRAIQGQISLIEMTERANHMVLPEVTMIDMRKELEDGNRSIFSRKLESEIEKNIQQGQQTLLFLNRRGYASFVLCRKCGFTLRCPNCNITLTYHASDNRLICHYCGYTIKNVELCPKCKSNYIRGFGTGTQKVEDEIKKNFPDSSVIRMDADTTTGKNSHEILLRTFREKNINIMVGTQMIAKGHDFPNVTLVGILAADSLLNIGDYKASERTFQLITQVAGRAGRGEIPGRVIIQSYNTEDFSIKAACTHDFITFYHQEIMIRQRLNYPPFTNIATVMLSGTNDRYVFGTSKRVGNEIALKFDEIRTEAEIMKPSRAPISKIKNKYRWRIVIKCKDIGQLIDVLTAASDQFYKENSNEAVDLNIDINPVNML